MNILQEIRALTRKSRSTRNPISISQNTVPDSSDEQRWDSLFKRLHDEGYAGIETPIGPFFPFQSNIELFLSLRNKYNLEWICQVHTCGYPLSSRLVADHVNSLRQFVRQAKLLNATRINCHSGADSWSLEQSLEYFREALKIEQVCADNVLLLFFVYSSFIHLVFINIHSFQEENIIIVHETHRQRILFNPWITRDILKQLPQLKVSHSLRSLRSLPIELFFFSHTSQINADLSHWVCVGERLFDERYDPEWPEILALVSQHCHLVHARVGHAQGPQVSDPSAPEFKEELETHERWWNEIWKTNQKQGFSEVRNGFIISHQCNSETELLASYSHLIVHDVRVTNPFLCFFFFFFDSLGLCRT
jgi:hypothetical protein